MSEHDFEDRFDDPPAPVPTFDPPAGEEAEGERAGVEFYSQEGNDPRDDKGPARPEDEVEPDPNAAPVSAEEL
jgi:hypothetical protein